MLVGACLTCLLRWVGVLVCSVFDFRVLDTFGLCYYFVCIDCLGCWVLLVGLPDCPFLACLWLLLYCLLLGLDLLFGW